MRAASSLHAPPKSSSGRASLKPRACAVDALVVAGHHLELVRQGDFVVAVEAVDYGKVNAEFIEYVGV